MEMMTLASWRRRFMWIAVGATMNPIAATADDAKPAAPSASLWEVPLLANAKYVARASVVSDGDYVSYERGGLSCRDAESLWAYSSDAPPDPAQLAASQKQCPGDLGKQFRLAVQDQQSALFVVDHAGKVLATRAELVAAALPIDTPAKAILAVWAAPYHFQAPGTYQPEWLDGESDGARPGAAKVRAVKDGFEVTAIRLAHGDCVPTAKEGPMRSLTRWRVVVHVDAHGALKEQRATKLPASSEFCGGMGRRPQGFVEPLHDPTVEGYLRRALHHEAESVRAFERLARELAFYGAPAELTEGARRAAEEERAHAARCAALVGAKPEIADDALPVRSRFELALDNQREGCVVESFGALVNAHQARHASTPALRAHFAAIAADELAHAALAHAIAAWIAPLLSDAERDAVHAAAASARAELADVRSELPPALGLPSAARCRELLAVLP